MTSAHVGNIRFGGVFVGVIPRIQVGDILEMKKPHPCATSGTRFRVLRVGSDIRIVCIACGRDLTLPRVKLEKSIKRIIPAEDASAQADHY